MKAVDQTNIEPGSGNCLQACLASIFELPIDSVPNFFLHGTDWLEALDKWLDVRFGLSVVLLKFHREPGFTRPRGWCIASGPTSGYPKHSVVWRDGSILHDPHPERPGLHHLQDLLVITVPDPAAIARSSDRPLQSRAGGAPSNL